MHQTTYNIMDDPVQSESVYILHTFIISFVKLASTYNEGLDSVTG